MPMTMPGSDEAPRPSGGEAIGRPVGPALPDWSPPPRPISAAMTGRHARLEPADPAAQAAALHAAYARDAQGLNWTYMASGPFATEAAFRDWMAQACLGDDPLFFAVRDLQTGALGGMVSYLRIAPAAGSIEIGNIHFAPEMQATRAATEAIYLMMRWAFEAGYRRFEWKCDALNARSRRAAMRLGFSFEGVFRQALVYKGRNRDTAWYACIDGEWPGLRAAFETWLAAENFTADGAQRRALSELTAGILVRRG